MALRRAPRGFAWAGLAVLATAGAAGANSLSQDVQVRVRLVSSSGVCSTVATEPAVQVACQVPPAVGNGRGATEASPGPRGPLLPEAGEVPYRRAGTMEVAAVGVAKEPLEVYSVGTKITSWRVVQLDNARYLELTIAW